MCQISGIFKVNCRRPFLQADLLSLKLLFCNGARVVFGHCECHAGTFPNFTPCRATTLGGCAFLGFIVWPLEVSHDCSMAT